MSELISVESVETSDVSSEEEAHYYHTLLAFEELVRNYGMEVIMETVDDDIYMEMFDFFMPPEFEDEIIPEHD